MKTLALVPARAGSKGIPGKNLRHFNGRPLLVWAIDTGLRTCTRTYVSTEDNPTAITAAQYGARIVSRPASLAADDTSMIAVVQHALTSIMWEDADVVVLLQPTQPLRTAQHVRDALRKMEETGADSVVSVVEVPGHYHPDWAMRATRDGRLLPWETDRLCDSLDRMPTRRQAMEPAYSRDGTVYVTRTEVVLAGSLYGDKCVPLIVPSHESVNLDTMDDWRRAEMMVSHEEAV